MSTPSDRSTLAVDAAWDNISGALGPARRIVARGVYGRIGAPARVMAALREPAGDPGMFGPGSMVWRVHGELPSMLIGGISALMLQTLHPLAMAGVDQHSDFREDPFSRLRNTSEFIAMTSFGSTAGANEAIARVRAVHTRVKGTAPDGRHYSAGNPALLTWVHVALVRSFLTGYQRYSGTPLTRTQQDVYFDEVALVATRLGAQEVPRSQQEVAAYLRRLRPELAATPAALETIDFLMKPPGQTPVERILYPVLAQACIDLLPAWARQKLSMTQPAPAQTVLVRRAAGAVGTLMRWGVGTPMSVRWATERVAAG
ncbi:MAG: oxygenase MpaB family protein [Candidatus Dormibacteria bacterium]